MSRLRADTLANLAAFGVMGVSGVVLNLFVVALSGKDALGVFNQVYAGYLIISMLAVFGVHDAVYREVAANPSRPDLQRESLASGLRLVFATGAVASVLMFVSAAPIGAFVDSEQVGRGLRLVAPALLLFAINKVLMASLAGHGRLQAFAIVQTVRILTLVSVVVGLAASGAAAGTLALGFGAAEVGIVPILVGLLRPSLSAGTGDHVREHLAFGARALPHGFVAESFLRVDVLMLAPLADDAAIGVYSLAAMFAEGLVQLGGTVRSVLGPRLVPTLAPDGDRAQRRRLLRQAMGLGLGMFAVVAAGLVLLFPWLGRLIDPVGVDQAYDVLLVLLVGLAANAAFFPLNQLLLWAGRPGGQSVMMSVNLGLNVVLNGALIPPLGVTGAALATACAWALSAVVSNGAAWMGLGFRWGIVGEALSRDR